MDYYTPCAWLAIVDILYFFCIFPQINHQLLDQDLR